MSRLEQARAEIAGRRLTAEAAAMGPWRSWNDGHVGNEGRLGGLLMPTVGNQDDPKTRRSTAEHIASWDPTHVLAVLVAADATLDRHVPDWGGECAVCWGDTWPCPDALAVLGLYAPQTDGDEP